MGTTEDKSEARPVPAKPADGAPPDIAGASVPDALATLRVNPDTGLTRVLTLPYRKPRIRELSWKSATVAWRHGAQKERWPGS